MANISEYALLAGIKKVVSPIEEAKQFLIENGEDPNDHDLELLVEQGF